MKNIAPFDFHFNGNHVRVVQDDNLELWFHAGDVCGVLGYVNSRKVVADHVDSDDVTKRYAVDSLGRGQQVNYVNESGLYALIFGSNKEEAKTFKKWVTSEVLPAIRKTGEYQLEQTPKSLSAGDIRLLDFAIKALKPDAPSKVKMIRTFGECRGQNMQFLPDYSKSEGVHHSLAELLKKHGSELSSMKANKLLEKAGLLERKTRASKSKGEKAFWSITPAGEKYGINQVSDRNQNETQPHWYDETFPALLEILEKTRELESVTTH